METPETLVPDQLSTAAVVANPYPAYQQFRSQTPLNYIDIPADRVSGIEGPIRAWALMNYDDVYGALRDHDTFSSARNPLVGVAFPPLVLILDDPPRHTRFRRLVNKTFTLKRVEELSPWITSVAEELMDAVGHGEKDLVHAYNIPLPMKVIAKMLGIPGEDYETFKRWSNAFLSLTSMDNTERMQNIQDSMTYFGKMAATRRAHGAEDLITALVEAEVDGEKLEEWELLGFCILLLIAGNETTTNLIGNMLHLLAEQPALWHQLREDRNLIDPMIEETLRYASPVQRLSRVTTRDVEVSGVTIPAGDLVTVFFGAANRDAKGFANPEEFRLDRDLRNHVAFGMGIHYCLGAPLARAEAKITLNAFLDRFPTITPGTAPAIRQTASPVVFGFQHLPLVLGNGGH